VRIRVKFDVPFKGYTYWTGTQFGAIQRPTNLFYLNKDPDVLKKWKEIPSGTFPSIEWIDFSNKEQDMGVTLAHFGIPSHEIRDNSIYLTLLRGVETLSADGTKGPCIATPDAAEKRPYTFKYSLIPHNGDWRDASSYKEGISFNMKPTAIHVSKKEHQIWNDKLSESDPAGTLVDTNLPNGFSFLSISPKNIILSTLKLPQDSSINSDSKGVILRLYETEGKTVTADIKFHYPIKSAAYVNLMENKKDNTMDAIMVSGPSKNILSLPIQGFKIISLRIEFDFHNQIQTNDDFL
jgi:alpha-mannosidase